MIEIAIMIEGQDGLTWDRWQRIARAVEALGFAGLYRSDHFTNASPPDQESLELWTSLTWLASHTSRIQFGPLVTPVSFRHPTLTARMAAAVDDLSDGRLILGLGAGWQAREHHNFGWDLLDVHDRFERFEEGLEVITRLLQQDTPVDFAGKYYNLREATLLPRPKRAGGPPILIGGNGLRRTLPLVARYASEWNAVYLSIPEFKSLSQSLDDLLEAQGRPASEVRRSLMVGCVFGKDEADLAQKVAARTRGNHTPQELQQRDLVVGTTNQIVEKLGQWSEAGVERVMLQWLDQDDIAGLEKMAQGIIPQL